MTSSFRTISATIPIGLYDRLRAAADRNDRPISWIIRQALQNYLDEIEDFSRESLEGAGLPRASPTLPQQRKSRT